MDAKGMVINDHNGSIFDPFRLHNFFERYERFTGLANPHETYFTEDSLISGNEVSEMQDFVGTAFIYRYEIRYE